MERALICSQVAKDDFNIDEVATLACQKGRKKEACSCFPCQCRRSLFGKNIPVQIQEQRRAALNAKLITSLKEDWPR